MADSPPRPTRATGGASSEGVSDDLRVTRSVVIPAGELHWRYAASGGPGGQHANTANTRVELRFDVAASAAFGPVQRERVLERIGPEVRIVASEERSQLRNREAARARLRARLLDALHVEAPRHATKPTRGSKERRLAGKARRSDVKQGRRRPSDGD